MFWFLIIGIVVIALLFILAEVLFVPGGILGVFGGLLLIYAIYLPYNEGYTILAHINTLVIFTVLTASLFTIIKQKSWKRVELKTSIKSSVRDDLRTVVSIGDIGTTISRLTPLGTIKLKGKTHEAKSDTGFINPKTEIEIISIDRNEIIVKPLK
ncbi:MAG: hypothetical protein KAG84_06620 [Bacteroidales bacterium]|nr:hypothetical protein [Bacteroidales bacterium]